MNKDRGTMKWNSLMLPEHIQRLRDWEQDMQYERAKELSEWELQSLEETIQYAYKNEKMLTLTLYQNYRFAKITGIIKAINNQKKQLLIESDAAVNLIYFDAIQSADSDD